MYGYSLTVVLFFIVALASPRQTANIQRLYLAVDKIVANRTSPAFSAIEDAFIIKELLDKETVRKEKKLNLKGLKVSLKQHPLKFEKINLKGERIGVAHFTNKFILKKNLEKKISLTSSFRDSQVQTRKMGTVTITTSQVKNLSSAGLGTNKEISQTIALPKGVSLTRPLVVVTAPVAGFARGSAATYEPNFISGSINFKGGESLYGENFNYYIERSVDGKIYETGVVDAGKGFFKMEIGSVKGILSVELRSEKGEVLAYGEHKINKSNMDLKNLEIQTFPSETLLAGRVMNSSESLEGKETAVAQAEKLVDGIEGVLKVDDEGYFNEELFEKGSLFIVKTKSKDYWSDLNFGIAGRPLYPRLIKKDIFSKFAETLDPFGEDIEIRSALVGSVTQKGLAQRNMSVRLYKNEYQKPVYFNSNGSVNPALVKTTTNGGFIFVNIPDGGYLVQAVHNNKVLAQKWYIVKEGHISQGQINIQSNPTLIASAESFPRSRSEEIFTLHELGIEKPFGLSSSGETEVRTYTNPELLALRMEKSESYHEHIYLTSSKVRKKRFRIIKKDWLGSFLNNRRSNANRAMGVVVGFVSQNDFRVIKETTTARSAGSQIFYFDRFGEATESGQIGGGFIITEVPSGLKSVVVGVKGRNVFLNKVIVAKPYSISVF